MCIVGRVSITDKPVLYLDLIPNQLIQAFAITWSAVMGWPVERLDEFSPREARRILVGHYEVRYEIQKSTIYLLRLWHTREDR